MMWAMDQAGGTEGAASRASRRRADPLVYRRRRLLAALAALAALAFVVGVAVGAGNGEGEPAAVASEASVDTPPELPGGGRILLPDYRLVGTFGAPQDPQLGDLGIGSPEEAADRALAQAEAYAEIGPDPRPIMPVFELLATIAAAEPGADELHIIRQPHRVIESYLEAARANDAYLLLDIQPGRADFEAEVKRLERWLVEPDVGLALDPEWSVGPTEIPGQVIGSVDAATVNAISSDLARIVIDNDLPEKLFVIHQFTDEMIVGRESLIDRQGIATVINIDGFGDQPNKVSKYAALRPERASRLNVGFKLFYFEDLNLMSPERVLGLKPPPDLIVYE